MEDNRRYIYPGGANSRTQNTTSRNTYRDNLIDGNAARKLQVLPNYIEDEELRQSPARRQEQKPKKKKAVKPAMDLMTLFILCIAVAGTLYTCIDYLKIQTTRLEQKKEINTLEKSLTKLANENTAAMSELNTSLDLNKIYEIATSQLGMVYPDKNQVIPYESNKSDFVKQYGEIPEENPKSLLDKILDGK